MQLWPVQSPLSLANLSNGRFSKVKPNKTVLKAVGFSLLALMIVNRVAAAAPVKKAIYG